MSFPEPRSYLLLAFGELQAGHFAVDAGPIAPALRFGVTAVQGGERGEAAAVLIPLSRGYSPIADLLTR